MQNYKDVCGKEEMIWFELNKLSEGRTFLKWAKSLGCVWLSGREIDCCERIAFTHLSINNEGKLGLVPISVWVSKQPEFQNIKRYVFCEFIKGAKI